MQEQLFLGSRFALESRAGLADIAQGGPVSQQPASRVFVKAEQSGESRSGRGGQVVPPKRQGDVARVQQVEEEWVPGVGVFSRGFSPEEFVEIHSSFEIARAIRRLV